MLKKYISLKCEVTGWTSLLFHHFHRLIIHFYRNNLHEKSAIIFKNKTFKVRRRWKSLNELIREKFDDDEKSQYKSSKSIYFVKNVPKKKDIIFFIFSATNHAIAISRMNGGVYVCVCIFSHFSQ